ncbi:MAG: hypothetical protein AAGD92_00005 [Pseudomonadota bacterium]
MNIPTLDDLEDINALVRSYGLPDFRTDEWEMLLCGYVENVCLPRELARRRRMSGDCRAAPADYCLHCGVDAGYAPICTGHGGVCVRLGRKRARNAAEAWARRQDCFGDAFTAEIETLTEEGGLLERLRRYRRRMGRFRVSPVSSEHGGPTSQ